MSENTTETAAAAPATADGAATAPVPSDLEIAQRATMRPIEDIAAAAGINPEALEFYGRFKAKVDPAAVSGDDAGAPVACVHEQPPPPPPPKAG